MPGGVDAQKLYVRLCDKARHVHPDPLVMELVQFGVVWGELDHYSEEKLAVLRRFLARADEGELLEVHLSVQNADQKARTARRKLRDLGLAEPLVQSPRESLSLCKALGRGLSRPSSRLTRVELHNIRLNDAAARSLAGGVSASSTLRQLLLPGCSMGDAVFEPLALAVARSGTLKDLSVAGCGLTNCSAAHVCHVLREHARRRGDARWASSLRGAPNPCAGPNVGLLALDLSGNALTDRAAEELAHALTYDDWFCALNLRDNPIGARGAEALLNSLLPDDAETLLVVDLRGTLDAAIPTVAKIDALLSSRHATYETAPPAGEAATGSSGTRPASAASAAVTTMGSIPAARTSGWFSRSDEVAETVASAVARWGSGHQLHPAVASQVAALANQSCAFRMDMLLRIAATAGNASLNSDTILQWNSLKRGSVDGVTCKDKVRPVSAPAKNSTDDGEAGAKEITTTVKVHLPRSERVPSLRRRRGPASTSTSSQRLSGQRSRSSRSSRSSRGYTMQSVQSESSKSSLRAAGSRHPNAGSGGGARRRRRIAKTNTSHTHEGKTYNEYLDRAALRERLITSGHTQTDFVSDDSTALRFATEVRLALERAASSADNARIAAILREAIPAKISAVENRSTDSTDKAGSGSSGIVIKGDGVSSTRDATIAKLERWVAELHASLDVLESGDKETIESGDKGTIECGDKGTIQLQQVVHDISKEVTERLNEKWNG